jgi:hypothetical protein
LKAESGSKSNRSLYKNLKFLIEDKSFSKFQTSLPETPTSISEEVLEMLCDK